MKQDHTSDDIDIIISGIDTDHNNSTLEDVDKLNAGNDKPELDAEKDDRMVITEIWGLSEQIEPSDAENFFQSKLLDAFRFYLRTVPLAIEGSFDFFKILPLDPSSKSTYYLHSLLSLLLECIQQAEGGKTSESAPKYMYRHLQRLIRIIIHPHAKDIQEQAYVLARAAMISTGAFDQNLSEIDAWLVSLTGICMKSCVTDSTGAQGVLELPVAVGLFLCDVVSTIGNNLYKHLGHPHLLISRLENIEDDSLGFSPLVTCVLEKCLRLLESESRTHKLYEKAMISLYVCNTISLILQTQVDARILSGLVHLILSEKFNERPEGDMDSKGDLCEWRPVKNLLCFAKSLFNQHSYSLFPRSISSTRQHSGSSLSFVAKIHDLIKEEDGSRLAGIAAAISSSIICTNPDDVLVNLPMLLAVMKQHFRFCVPFLSWILLQEWSFLAIAVDRELELFTSGLKMIEGVLRKHKGMVFQVRKSSEVHQYLLDSAEPASSAALFLYSAPFYALFSSVISVGYFNSSSGGKVDILHSNTMMLLLQIKLSEGSFEDCVTSLRIVLFWTNQTMLSYKATPSNALEECVGLCITLIRYLLDHILVVVADINRFKSLGAPYVTLYLQNTIDLLFLHPAVAFSLSQPLCFSSLRDNVQDIMTSAEKFHPIDRNLLQLTEIVYDFVFSVRKLRKHSSKICDFSSGLILSAPKSLIEDSVEKLKLCTLEGDPDLLLRRFYVMSALLKFVSPFELLEVVEWMFCKLDGGLRESTMPFANVVASIGAYIANDALGVISSCLRRQEVNPEVNWLWDRKPRSFDASILLNLYHKIQDFAVCLKLQYADACLLKFVSAARCHKYAEPQPGLIPLCAQLSRMMVKTPIKLLVHCFYPTSKIKGKLLLELIEASPMHMNLFGKIFLAILNNDFSDLIPLDNDDACSAKWKPTNEDGKHNFSDNDFLLLLPAGLSYLIFNMQNCGKKGPKLLEIIAKFYSSMLLNGLSNWKDFVSRDIFREEYAETRLMSPEDFHHFCCSTLLGKAITMLHYSFILCRSAAKAEKLLVIFDSIHSAGPLFDPSVLGLKDLSSVSYNELLKVIDTIVAKVFFMRLLLCPPENLIQYSVMQANGELSETWNCRESKIIDYAKRFIGILADALDYIVREVPLGVDFSNTSYISDCCPLRFLEHFILSNIVGLTNSIKNYLRESPPIPSLGQFIRSSLLHRFEDPSTLRAIRCILVALSETGFSFSEVLAQLFSHPKFVPTIARACGFPDSSSLASCETSLQPLPSILKSIDIPHLHRTLLDGRHTSDVYSKVHYHHYSSEETKLETVKLLRILFHLRGSQRSPGPASYYGMNPRELISLLLSGYSATVHEVDLEVLHLLHEIETSEESFSGSMANMDYLWGASAMKLRSELSVDELFSSNVFANSQMISEKRKIFFRENVPVTMKLSIATVMHFCNDRTSRTASMSLQRLLEDKSMQSSEGVSSSNVDTVQRYDPVFILRFSSHCLSRGYLEPAEFARLGLLAITLVSISSSDEEVRKLGYDCLGKFMKIFENYQKRKDKRPLHLLLTNIQNLITERWQRIPTVTAIFAAEASLVLLDSSQNHFVTLIEFLTHSPRMDLKMIPLYPKLFQSGSIHFKTDRLWILRLLYAGLSSDVDAEIYIKQGVLKLLLSFCASSLVDHESKVLILQILKKCADLPTAAFCLIKEHGLVSWLSSVLLFHWERLSLDYTESSLAIMELVLKVLSDAIYSETVREWLQEHAFEQLSGLSSHIHALLVGSLKLLKENVPLVNSLLSVIVTTLQMSLNRVLKVSEDRKIYLPRFTLSLLGLFRLYQTIVRELGNLETGSTSQMVLNIILLSAPVPVSDHMDTARLSKLLTWAIPAALRPTFMQRSPPSIHDPGLLSPFNEHQGRESLVSKILRWALASVIPGSFTKINSNMEKRILISRLSSGSLQPILREIITKECETGENYSSSNQALAIILLYLQELLGRNCSFLPSISLALCVLLLGKSSDKSGDNTSFSVISDEIVSRSSKIQCPPEVNPDWRWSYDQPWPWRDEDRPPPRTAREEMEEEQACRSILLMFSNALDGQSSNSSFLSHEDVEKSGLYEWQKDTFLGSKISKKRKQESIE